jgi:hypothetical protein
MRRLRLGQLARFVRSYTDTGGLSKRAAAETLLWSGGVRVLLDAWAAKLMPGVKSQYHRRRAGARRCRIGCADLELHGDRPRHPARPAPRVAHGQGKVPASFPPRAALGREPYFVYEFELGSTSSRRAGCGCSAPITIVGWCGFSTPCRRRSSSTGPATGTAAAGGRSAAPRRSNWRLSGRSRAGSGADAHRRSLWQGVAAAWPKLRDFPAWRPLGSSTQRGLDPLRLDPGDGVDRTGRDVP